MYTTNIKVIQGTFQKLDGDIVLAAIAIRVLEVLRDPDLSEHVATTMALLNFLRSLPVEIEFISIGADAFYRKMWYQESLRAKADAEVFTT